MQSILNNICLLYELRKYIQSIIRSYKAIGRLEQNAYGFANKQFTKGWVKIYFFTHLILIVKIIVIQIHTFEIIFFVVNIWILASEIFIPCTTVTVQFRASKGQCHGC